LFNYANGISVGACKINTGIVFVLRALSAVFLAVTEETRAEDVDNKYCPLVRWRILKRACWCMVSNTRVNSALWNKGGGLEKLHRGYM
jgi:hypothetical protein